MYLLPSNKWKQFLLAEGIENIGLPSSVVDWVRTITGKMLFSVQAANQAEEAGNPWTPLTDKMLTYLGLLLKKHPTVIFSAPRAKDTVDTIKRALHTGAPIFGELTDREKEQKFNELTRPIFEFISDHGGLDQPTQTVVDVKALNKRIGKALKKAGAADRFVNRLLDKLDRNIMHGLDNDTRPMIQLIALELAKDPPIYDEVFKTIETLQGAYGAAQELKEKPKKEEEKVIHKFDDGFYWYDVGACRDKFEEKEMAHCGVASNPLYSLREGEGRKMKPRVTIEFGDLIVYQIKGKANQAPDEKWWPHISWFIENMGVERIEESGHHKDQEAFRKMLTYLAEQFPDLERGAGFSEAMEEIILQWEPDIEVDHETNFDYEIQDDGLGLEVSLTHYMHFPVKQSFYEKAKGNQSNSEVLWNFHQLALEDSVLFIPKPSIQGPGTATRYLFAKGEVDSETAMLRLILNFSQDFGGPQDQDRPETLAALEDYLEKLAKLSEHFVSTGTAAYNEYYNDLEDNLTEAGVWNDIAGEIDAEDAREEQPEEELQEQRIIQRWGKIIK
jgi:hypothetical protein